MVRRRKERRLKSVQKCCVNLAQTQPVVSADIPTRIIGRSSSSSMFAASRTGRFHAGKPEAGRGLQNRDGLACFYDITASGAAYNEEDRNLEFQMKMPEKIGHEEGLRKGRKERKRKP